MGEVMKKGWDCSKKPDLKTNFELVQDNEQHSNN